VLVRIIARNTTKAARGGKPVKILAKKTQTGQQKLMDGLRSTGAGRGSIRTLGEGGEGVHQGNVVCRLC